MENLMAVVDRLGELQASSVGRRECSSTRQRMRARRMDVHVDTYSQPCPRATGCGHCPGTWWRSREVAAFARLYVFGRLCVDMWFVHQWSFFCCLTVFWLYLTICTLYQSSKTLKTICVPIVTGLPRLYQQCTNGVPIVKNSQKTVKTAKMTIGVPSVTCLRRLYQQCANNVPIVKNSQKQKTVKTAKMTIGVPIVTCLPRLYQQWKTVKRQSKQQKLGVKVKGLRNWDLRG